MKNEQGILNVEFSSIKTLFGKFCRSFFILHFSFFIFSTCTPVPKKITPAFYHWQTELTLSDFEKKYLDDFQVQKLYVKFFDVDWDVASGEPLPVAEVVLDSIDMPTEKVGIQNLEIIPTVFITNRSLKNYPLEKMEELGGHILDKIFEIKKPTSEIQIDCDWSVGTKEKYFRLLDFLKKEISSPGSRGLKNELQLSVTIRLHQVKYFERTGVPPVDKGMLMFYNTGEVKNPQTENSILELATAKKYIYNFEKYPLDLDVALPIFSWGVLFRNGKMIKLIAHLREEDLSDENRFSKIDKKHFEIIKSTYLDGRYLYQDDVIRLETIEMEQLEAAALLLKDAIQNDDLTISFYHLDESTIKHYPYEDLQNICNLFR